MFSDEASMKKLCRYRNCKREVPLAFLDRQPQESCFALKSPARIVGMSLFSKRGISEILFV